MMKTSESDLADLAAFRRHDMARYVALVKTELARGRLLGDWRHVQRVLQSAEKSLRTGWLVEPYCCHLQGIVDKAARGIR